MKTLFAVFVGILVFGTQSAMASSGEPFKAKFTVSGHCEGNAWIEEGNGNGHWDKFEFRAPSEPGNLGFATIENVGAITVSTGPWNDGAGGCILFKSMLECKSGKGTFVIDDGNAGIYHVPPTVAEFSCEK